MLVSSQNENSFFKNTLFSEDHASLTLRLSTFGCEEFDYQPGDHLAVYPRNPPELVQLFSSRVNNCPAPDSVVQLEIQQADRSWAAHKIPPFPLSTLLARFVDLTSAPSQEVLHLLSASAADEKEREVLLQLAEVSDVIFNNKKCRFMFLNLLVIFCRRNWMLIPSGSRMRVQTLWTSCSTTRRLQWTRHI